MSSINHFSTFTYSQPHEYRLSHDSVFFARRVYEIICNESIEVSKSLDLCSGSGVVGLDLLFHMSEGKQNSMPDEFEFLEIQNEYEPHFNTNVKTLNSIKSLDTKIVFSNTSYSDQSYLDKNRNAFDLIVCNPPYFRLGMGKMSSSEFKNRCRYFIDSSFKSLIESVEILLKDGGVCFLITRPLEHHNIDVIRDIKKHCNLDIQILNPVRKSLFIKLSKI